VCGRDQFTATRYGIRIRCVIRTRTTVQLLWCWTRSFGVVAVSSPWWNRGVSSSDHADDDVRGFFASFADAHAREDVTAYLQFFAPDTVWVTSRGVCYRGREELGAYLSKVLPGGLGSGTVRYTVESVHPAVPGARLVVVDQTYLDADGHPRDGHARHTHLYVVVNSGKSLLIAAGQNTVRT
jgi:uncharacterized protein (TIGR02246 family)